MSYLVFVWKPTGYELRERDGEPPGVGQQIEEDATPMTVTKVAPSPLPGDPRRCVYVQAA
jgi:hypothetical protein